MIVLRLLTEVPARKAEQYTFPANTGAVRNVADTAAVVFVAVTVTVAMTGASRLSVGAANYKKQQTKVLVMDEINSNTDRAYRSSGPQSVW